MDRVESWGEGGIRNYTRVGPKHSAVILRRESFKCRANMGE